MWSEIYSNYVENIIESNREQYPYYVAHTCTYWGVSNSSSLASFKIYFSTEPITANGGYSYIFSDTAICYSVVGSTASSSYNNTRVTTSEFSGTLSIDDYEFIYTNAEFSGLTLQPDILATNNVTQSHFDGIALIISCLLILTLTLRLLKG